MTELIRNTGYKNWLKELKSKIQQSQIKAALAVNSQLILLYYDLGRKIVEQQENAKWGSGFINQLSKDLTHIAVTPTEIEHYQRFHFF